MALSMILARHSRSQTVLFIHDMWTYGNALDAGDVDDSVNVSWLDRMYDTVYVYIVNDTGDNRRYEGFVKKYREVLPHVRFLHHESEFPSVNKVGICAPLHPLHDARMVHYLRTHVPGRTFYGQGDTERAYNLTHSALLPYLSFSPPTLLTVNEEGVEHAVPITLYNTNATNRKMEVVMLSAIACPALTHEVLVYAKHKLCFLPEKPFAIGLLMKKYGTGNTTYGLCHAKQLMDVEDTSDPDLVLQKYFCKVSHQKNSDSYVNHLLLKYPTVYGYYLRMCSTYHDRLASPDSLVFMRALAMVILCTVEWFGEKALHDRFRTLADDDVVASVDGMERYSPSMFDLVVGVAATYDLTTTELSEMLPGGPNQVMKGPFIELLNLKMKKD